MADLQAKAILSAEDRASAVLAMVARNFDRLNKAADAMHTRDSRVKQADAFNATIERRAAAMAALTKAYSVADRGVGMIPGMYASGGLALAPLAAAAAALKAKRAFAEQERAMTRIAITGDANRAQQDQAALDIERIAARTSLAMKDVREGADTLVAAGRSLPDAMKFLPSVAETAQATGAAVNDIAKSADALETSLKISSGDMQSAFDMMAAGGKAGKFELKDMARYFAEIAPLAKTAGMKGTEGLSSLVAALQMVRKESGTSEEAATNLKNVFSKMYSQETQKKFEKGGVNLRKQLDEAEKNGGNLLETFVKITAEATKSGKIKLPELFEDMQAQAGMRALINNMQEWKTLQNEIKNNSAGSVGKDLKRVLADSQTGFDRLSASASRAWRNIGESAPVVGAVNAVATAIEKMNDAMERNAEVKRQLDDAGVKPIAPLKSKAATEAEAVLNNLGGGKPVSGSRKDAYGDDWINRSPAELAAQAMERRMQYQQQLDREIRSRAGRNVGERARESDVIASGDGTFTGPDGNKYSYSDLQKQIQAQRDYLRGNGGTMQSVDDRRSAAERDIPRLMQKVQELESQGPARTGSTGDLELRAAIRQLEQKVTERETAKRQLSGGGYAVTPDEVRSIINEMRKSPGENGDIKAKVEPDQITAKIDGKVEVGTTVRVEASPDFITSIVSRVKSAVGPVFGSTGTSDGQSQP